MEKDIVAFIQLGATSVVMVGILELAALCCGVDGTALAATIAGIVAMPAAIGGYIFKKYRK